MIRCCRKWSNADTSGPKLMHVILICSYISYMQLNILYAWFSFESWNNLNYINKWVLLWKYNTVFSDCLAEKKLFVIDFHVNTGKTFTKNYFLWDWDYRYPEFCIMFFILSINWFQPLHWFYHSTYTLVHHLHFHSYS